VIILEYYGGLANKDKYLIPEGKIHHQQADDLGKYLLRAVDE